MLVKDLIDILATLNKDAEILVNVRGITKSLEAACVFEDGAEIYLYGED